MNLAYTSKNYSGFLSNFKNFYNKYPLLLVLAVIFIGICLQIYGAINSVITEDEWYDFQSAEEISFSLKNPNLPLFDNTYEDASPMPFAYIIKIGLELFGHTFFAGRAPFIIIATCTILLTYIMTKTILGKDIAFMSVIILAFSPSYIGLSIATSLHIIIIFFTTLSLLLFFNAIQNNNIFLLFLNGFIIGLGIWFKEPLLLLIFIYLIFLFTSKKYKHWLKNKNLWFSFMITLIVILPLIYLNLQPNNHRIKYITNEIQFGPSLNAATLYLGEFILLALKAINPVFFKFVIADMNYLVPVVNLFLGFLILLAVVKESLAVFNPNKDVDPFIKLMLIVFLFNFILFSAARCPHNITGIWALESYFWSIMGFIPAVILVSKMLIDYISRKRIKGMFLILSLIIFMLFRTWSMLNFPLKCPFPGEEACIEGLLKNHIGCMKIPNLDNIIKKDIYKRILLVKNTSWESKKKAAFRLVNIFTSQDRTDEAKKYLSYILSKEPDNKEALKLFHAVDQ